MPKLDVLDQQGATVGEIELADAIFGITPNEHVVHDAVVMQQASLRQGTHATKNRSAVRGGGRKPWRQKGTGRARAGSTRSPIWVGGGVAFGPVPRSYSYKLPKKVRRLALKSVLSAKVQDEEMIVLDDIQLNEIKTKEIVSILKQLNVVNKVLLVTAEEDDQLYRASRNIPGVTCLPAHKINVLDILYHDHFIITKDAVSKVEEVLGA